MVAPSLTFIKPLAMKLGESINCRVRDIAYDLIFVSVREKVSKSVNNYIWSILIKLVFHAIYESNLNLFGIG